VTPHRIRRDYSSRGSDFSVWACWDNLLYRRATRRIWKCITILDWSSTHCIALISGEVCLQLFKVFSEVVFISELNTVKGEKKLSSMSAPGGPAIQISELGLREFEFGRHCVLY